MLAAELCTMSYHNAPLVTHWPSSSSVRMMSTSLISMLRLFCKADPTAKTPSVPAPLPPATPPASSTITLLPFSAACTAAERPEIPAPTMTISQLKVSAMSVGTLGASLVVLPFSSSAFSAVFGCAQPARPNSAAVPKAPEMNPRRLSPSQVALLLSS